MQFDLFINSFNIPRPSQFFGASVQTAPNFFSHERQNSPTLFDTIYLYLE